MQLKRLYDHSGDTPRVRGVRVVHAGKKQKFSMKLIGQAADQGWLTMGKGRIVIHDEDGDIVYRVVRTPGFYCCHCGARLVGDPRIDDGKEGAAQRLAHVVEKHGDAPSPDAENPAGYMGTTSIKGVLVEGGKNG
jgi:hypothetical protein